MKNIFKLLFRYLLKYFRVWTIPVGLNKGLKLRYYEDVIQRMYLGWHERNTLFLFKYFIKPNMVVFDVGASVGYFTKIINDKVGPQGKGYFFEPKSDTFERLQDTIKLNHLQNVIAVNKGVSNIEGTQKLYLGSSHFESSLDIKWAQENTSFEEIQVVTLDHFCSQNKIIPDLIKLDIEGGGVWAVEGIKGIIRAYRPILILESHTPDEDRAFTELVNLVPYVLFRVGSTLEIKGTMDALGTALGISGTILAVPKEKIVNDSQFNTRFFQRMGNR